MRNSAVILALTILASGCGGGEEATVRPSAAVLPEPATGNEVGSKFTSLTIGTQIMDCQSAKDKNIAFTKNFNDTIYNSGLTTCSIDLATSWSCPLAHLRNWIGHTYGGAVVTGFTREQAFAFDHLVPNQTYVLRVYISASRGSFEARAYGFGLQVTKGQAYNISANLKDWGCSPIGEYWEIQFSSRTTSGILKITNDHIADANYFFPSHYVLSKI